MVTDGVRPPHQQPQGCGGRQFLALTVPFALRVNHLWSLTVSGPPGPFRDPPSLRFPFTQINFLGLGSIAISSYKVPKGDQKG